VRFPAFSRHGAAACFLFSQTFGDQPMKTWLIISVSWFAIGLISYVLILLFFESPVSDRRLPGGGGGEEKGYRLPPFWNSLRITLFSLIGVVLVPLMAPVFLLALVCYRFLRPTNRPSE
jgi:hypothetical protein